WKPSCSVFNILIMLQVRMRRKDQGAGPAMAPVPLRAKLRHVGRAVILGRNDSFHNSVLLSGIWAKFVDRVASNCPTRYGLIRVQGDCGVAWRNRNRSARFHR